MGQVAARRRPLERGWLGSLRRLLLAPLPNHAQIDRVVVGLRWLALLVVLVLWLFEPRREDLVPTPAMLLAVAVYNVAVLRLRRSLPWPRHMLNVLALDIAVATLAVYLTGGYLSSFFLIYFLAMVGAALYLTLVPTLVLGASLAVIYAIVSFLVPPGFGEPFAVYILAAKVALLLMFTVLSGLLLAQLRIEQRETEREQLLSARLAALNDLLRELSASLDMSQVFQTLVQAARRLLDADVAVIMLREEGERAPRVVAHAGHEAKSFGDGAVRFGERIVRRVMASGRPAVVEDIAQLNEGGAPLVPDGLSGAVACVPIRLEEAPIGVLMIGTRQPRLFPPDQVELLSTLAREATIAIRNARLYERERATAEHWQRLGEQQSSFLSAVSHELRTPLTCIRASVDLLLADPSGMSETQRELSHTIADHTSRLEGLVNDLFEAARLETGGVRLSPQRSDLGTVVARVARAFAPLVEKRQQRLRLDLPSAPVPVAIDRRRIDQVVSNLLSNANKFTPRGGHILVTVRQEGNEAVVRVADSGPGVPTDKLSRVFDKFYVVGERTPGSGMGLGLYIARQLVELHGGRIWVENRARRGSVFAFALPLQADGPVGTDEEGEA